MDPRLLRYYNRELQHLRDMGGEFAKAYPKIAGRLGLESLECADPYVERLLEGFAFLAARVQLKLDAEFPKFTQHLLELLYPHYLAPTPSMMVVQLKPDLNEGALSEGFVVPRQTSLRGELGKNDQTPCEYRTGHDVTLWPLEITEVEYYPTPVGVPPVRIPHAAPVRAGLRIRLRCTAGLTFDKLALDRLCLYLQGAEGIPTELYEQIVGHTIGLVARPADNSGAWQQVVPGPCVEALGFDEDEALLPYGARSFSGYRLLHEYFSFPQRYLFVELSGLQPAVKQCGKDQMDLFILLDRSSNELVQSVDEDVFALFCTPAINLFPKRADRIHLSTTQYEYHVLPDRTKPIDFEVYEVSSVTGIGTSAEQKQEFYPFYSAKGLRQFREQQAYYTVRRLPRLASIEAQRRGRRSSYAGGEVFLSIVDAKEAPYSTNLRQLAVQTMCTNRDLPLFMPLGKGATDFTLESGAPVESVRALAGPTKPKPSHAVGETAWRLISHLSLNYLSLVDSDEEHGAAALRELLSLYGDIGEPAIIHQIDGVRHIETRPITGRMPGKGPISFGRGLGITITCEEGAFTGIGAFLLGAVLDRFFAEYVSLNSFTQTTLRTPERGEVMTWPARIGQRHRL